MKIFQNNEGPEPSKNAHDIEMVSLTPAQPQAATFKPTLPPAPLARLELTLYLSKKIKFHLPKLKINFSLAVTMAHHEYQHQPENKKSAPLDRFWPKPQNLKERTLQFIAAQEIMTGKTFSDTDLLPQELKQLKDQWLNDFKGGVESERRTLLLNTLLNTLPPPPGPPFTFPSARAFS